MIFILATDISRWYPTKELRRAEHALRAAEEEGKAGGALPATSCIAEPDCSKNLQKRFAETDASAQQHFCKPSRVAQCCQVKQLHAALKLSTLPPRECWRALWQPPAPLTGLRSTRKNCHLFSRWTAAEKRGVAIHAAIQPQYKTNSRIKWGSR